MKELSSYSNDEFDKNSKKKEVIEHSSEILRNYLSQYIPFYGPLINDILNFKSELEKKRTIKFLEGFINKYKKEFGKSFSVEELEDESFSELFNLVLLKIQNTKSEYKKDRFRDILLLKFRLSSEDFLFVKFVELLDKINEIQIILLKEMSETERFKYGIGSHKGTEIIKSFTDKLILTDEDNLIKIFSPYLFKSKDSELEFFINELNSFGLIKSIPVKNRIEKSKSSQTNKYIITDIGSKFLHFILNQQ